MDGLSVKGAKVYFAIETPFGDINITQTTISLLAVTLLLMLTAFLVTRKLSKRPGRVQVVVEKLVTMLYNLVEDTMGKHNIKYAPYIGTLFLSSMIGTLLGMTQIFRSVTADLSVTLAWAILTSILVWRESIKNAGLKSFLKGYINPMNIISEIAQPISMAFRLFGNVSGGGIISSIVYVALSSLTTLVFSWLPTAILECMPPLFVAGIPAFLSIYFDLFSSFVQSLVFSLLTMVYVGTAAPPPEVKPETKAELADTAAETK